MRHESEAMRLDKRLKTVSACILFSGCTREEIRSLLNDPSLTVESCPQGAYLMQRDSDRHFLGILQKGTAVVERRAEDGLMHMSRLQEGDLFGAASVFCANENYVVDIRCITDCSVLLLKEDALLNWFRLNENILRNYLGYLTKRIRFLNQRLDALSKYNVPSKLMTFFLAESADGIVQIKSYTELAEALCLSRATLYRALDSLCADGKILREGKKIILLEDTNQ